MRGENDIPNIEKCGRKTHVVVDFKHHVALRMRRLQKTEKKEEEIFYVPGNTLPSRDRRRP